jgi:hypothetical protein
MRARRLPTGQVDQWMAVPSAIAEQLGQPAAYSGPNMKW